MNGIVYHVKNDSHGPKDNVSALCCLVTSLTLVASLNHDDGDVHHKDVFLMNHVKHIFHLNLMNHVKHIFHLNSMNHVNHILHLDFYHHQKDIFLLDFRHLHFHHLRMHHQQQANHSPDPTISSA